MNTPLRSALDTPRRVPDSDRSYTAKQIDDNFNPPDWHPEDHPVPPPPVLHGKPPEARACGLCHLPIGTGHPESSYIAGQLAKWQAVAKAANIRLD